METPIIDKRIKELTVIRLQKTHLIESKRGDLKQILTTLSRLWKWKKELNNIKINKIT